MAFNLKMESGWSDRFPMLLRGTKGTILTRGLGSLLCVHSRQIVPQSGRRKARLASEALKQLSGSPQQQKENGGNGFARSSG